MFRLGGNHHQATLKPYWGVQSNCVHNGITKFKLQGTAWTLNMEPIGSPETSVLLTNLRNVNTLAERGCHLSYHETLP